MKTTLGELALKNIPGFADMSLEGKLEALRNMELPSPEEVEAQKEEINSLKQAISKANSEAKVYKDKLRSLGGAEETPPLSDRFAELEEQIATLTKEREVTQNFAVFVALGYPEELAKSSAKALAEGDMETYFSDARKNIQLRTDNLKAELIKSTPRPASGGGKRTVTKEQFDKMGYSELIALYQDNRELYDYYMSQD